MCIITHLTKDFGIVNVDVSKALRMKRIFLLSLLLIHFPAKASSPLNQRLNQRQPISVDKKISSLNNAAHNSVNPKVLKLALTAYNCAVLSGQGKQEKLTIVDYSRPSSERRLWVFDLANDKLLFNSLVAHGKGSGEAFANHFSDKPETHASSLGLFITGNVYKGRDGYSLKLLGLEENFNSHAESRNIVIHGAPYVNEMLASSGRIGRSWGCPAVPKQLAAPIINTIKDGGVVFSYYPDANWLKESKYLHCAAIPSQAEA